jgi:mannose/fructose-specific phosphotransferase system component IIA
MVSPEILRPYKRGGAVKIILASHGSLAPSMLEVVRMILGSEDDIEAFCLDTCETPSRIASLVRGRIEAAAGAPVVLVSDIKGGSVFNSLLPLCETPGVTLFAGMNLDMVLDLVNTDPETPEALDGVMQTAKDAVVRFDKDILADLSRQNNSEKEDSLW